MYLVARDYQQGVPRWTLNDLSEQFDVPARALKPIIETLESHELLVTTDDDRYVPGRDPAHIGLREIFDALRRYFLRAAQARFAAKHSSSRLTTAM
jgi:DNA-binding IclR family transcriptional regulator